jgi:hypothetical protein
MRLEKPFRARERAIEQLGDERCRIYVAEKFPISAVTVATEFEFM